MTSRIKYSIDGACGSSLEQIEKDLDQDLKALNRNVKKRPKQCTGVHYQHDGTGKRIKKSVPTTLNTNPRPRRYSNVQFAFCITR